MRSIVVMLVLGVPVAALATPQMEEELRFKGVNYRIAAAPLRPYLERWRPRVTIPGGGTDCWRGYRGSWTISGDQLALTALSPCRGRQDLVKLLFGDRKLPIPATWFSGVLALPQGAIIARGREEVVYEQELLLWLRDGKLIKERVVDRRTVEVTNPRRLTAATLARALGKVGAQVAAACATPKPPAKLELEIGITPRGDPAWARVEGDLPDAYRECVADAVRMLARFPPQGSTTTVRSALVLPRGD